MLRAKLLRRSPIHGLGAALSARTAAKPRGLWDLGKNWPEGPEGDAELAREFYRGRYVLGGAEVNAPGIGLFACKAASPEWREAAQSFGWLDHLEASGSELYRVFARGQVLDWDRRHGRGGHAAGDLEIAARRAGNLVRHAPFLLTGASEHFEKEFFRLVDRELNWLARKGAKSLMATLALAVAALAVRGYEAREEEWLKMLGEAVENAVLPDGVARSRNPADMLDLLLALLPIRAAAEERGLPLPHGLSAAIERMLPMLRFFRHGDNGLAAFQGATGSRTADTRRALERDSSLGLPVSHAQHGGYVRLQQANALVIADVGDGAAADAALAFEFSDAVNRIVVNCGLLAEGRAHWRQAGLARAAHSTLDPLFAARGGRGRGVEKIAEVAVGPRGSILRAVHPGLAQSHGLVHERDMFLAPGGNDLRGEDRIASLEKGPAPFELRFHLHPSIKTTLVRDGETVVLQLPNRAGWRFLVKGGRARLEESVYLFGQSEPRRAQQIAIRGDAEQPVRLQWAFKRIRKRGQAGGGDDQMSLEWE
jgi:uncharacterized heparinase superfamily protein